jgi:hypothetical protein
VKATCSLRNCDLGGQKRNEPCSNIGNERTDLFMTLQSESKSMLDRYSRPVKPKF